MKNLIILFILIAPIKLLGQQKPSDSLQVLIDSIKNNNLKYINDYYFTDYYRNGKIKEKGYRIIMERENNWEDLVPVGKWIYYYKNGVISSIEYRDISGNFINKESQYNKKGELIYELFYENGDSFQKKRHNFIQLIKGYTIKSYKKGILFYSITMIAIKGKPYESGKEIFYNPDGSIKKEHLYKDGKKIS